MKILILTNEDDGLYQFRKELIDALRSEHEVFLSMPFGSRIEYFKNKGCKFINTSIDRRGINPIKDISLIFKYYKIIMSIQPDIIISYTIKPNVYGGIITRILNKNFFANITGLGTAFQKDSILKKIVTKLYRLALKSAKIVFFENKGNLDLFISNKIISDFQHCLLPGAGVNLTQYKALPYPSTTAVHFLFIGRVMKEKGIEELIAACSRLHQNQFSFTLTIVGPFEEDYSQLFDDYKDQGWLQYKGYQGNILPFLEQSHCFVLPSWHEGMANTNLEAAACARPVITSNIYGCREAIVENHSGILCEPKNEDSLYNALVAFIALPHNTKEEMGKFGRKHMELYFDKDIVVKTTINEIFKRA